MTDREWTGFLHFVQGEPIKHIPAGMIVDSPWIPGYCRVDTVDYYTDGNIWLACQDQLRSDFPGILFLPGDWVEFGMDSSQRRE